LQMQRDAHSDHPCAENDHISAHIRTRLFLRDQITPESFSC
jgi:hypothetical protein